MRIRAKSSWRHRCSKILHCYEGRSDNAIRHYHTSESHPVRILSNGLSTAYEFIFGIIQSLKRFPPQRNIKVGFF